MRNLSALRKDWTELILRPALGMAGETRLQLHWPPPQWGNLPFGLTLHWKWSPLVPFCLSKAWHWCGSSCSIWKGAMEKAWQHRQDSRLLWAALVSTNSEGEAHCSLHWICGENGSKNQGEQQQQNIWKESKLMHGSISRAKAAISWVPPRRLSAQHWWQHKPRLKKLSISHAAPPSLHPSHVNFPH